MSADNESDDQGIPDDEAATDEGVDGVNDDGEEEDAANATPEVGRGVLRLSDALKRQNVTGLDFTKLLGTARYSEMFSQLAKGTMADTAAKRQALLFSTKLPSFRVAESVKAMTAFQGLDKQYFNQLSPIYGAFLEVQRSQMASILANVRAITGRTEPPNWTGLPNPFDDLDRIDTLLLDEGHCLGWVPPTPVLARVLRARRRGAGARLLAEVGRQSSSTPANVSTVSHTRDYRITPRSPTLRPRQSSADTPTLRRHLRATCWTPSCGSS